MAFADVKIQVLEPEQKCSGCGEPLTDTRHSTGRPDLFVDCQDVPWTRPRAPEVAALESLLAAIVVIAPGSGDACIKLLEAISLFTGVVAVLRPHPRFVPENVDNEEWEAFARVYGKIVAQEFNQLRESPANPPEPEDDEEDGGSSG